MNEDELKDRILNEMVGHKIPLTVEQIERILFAVSHITMLKPMDEETKDIFLNIYDYLQKQLDIAQECEKERNTRVAIIREKLLVSKREDLVSFLLITESNNWLVLRGSRDKAYLIKEALENIHTVLIKDENETEVDKTGEIICRELNENA